MMVPLPYRALSLKTSAIVTVTIFILITVFTDRQIYPTTIYKEKQPPITYFQGDWQNTGHSTHKFFIYSAYSYDNNQVVIIGGPRPNLQKKDLQIYCQFHKSSNENKNANFSKSTTTKAKAESLKGWASKVAGSFIRCTLPKSSEPFEYISILLGNQTYSPARLPIQYRNISEPNNYQYKFSACVLPLYGYNQVFHLIEWMEYYRMMGVEHFTFYNLTIGPSASCVMNNYNKWTNGQVSVKINPWHNYPQKKDKEIHFGKGLTPGINDCFYGNKGVSKYLVFVDVDEFIVPEMENLDDFGKLIDNLDRNFDAGNNKFAEYRFRCAFYEKSRNKDDKLLERCDRFRENFVDFKVCQELWMMKFDKREGFRHYQSRSKYIARPEGIRNAGNHFAYEFEKGWGKLLVPESVGFMRHYRYFEKENKTTSQRIRDGIGMGLVSRVANGLEYFRNVCGFSDEQLFS